MRRKLSKVHLDCKRYKSSDTCVILSKNKLSESTTNEKLYITFEEFVCELARNKIYRKVSQKIYFVIPKRNMVKKKGFKELHVSRLLYI